VCVLQRLQIAHVTHIHTDTCLLALGNLADSIDALKVTAVVAAEAGAVEGR